MSQISGDVSYSDLYVHTWNKILLTGVSIFTQWWFRPIYNADRVGLSSTVKDISIQAETVFRIASVPHCFLRGFKDNLKAEPVGCGSMVSSRPSRCESVMIIYAKDTGP